MLLIGPVDTDDGGELINSLDFHLYPPGVRVFEEHVTSLFAGLIGVGARLSLSMRLNECLLLARRSC